ncbi:MAG TPA: lysophospholipase [Candidatus Omnitrophota bacterium]|nr:lysophospholipase [Candidatus Omnitrophota bacterium]HPT07285.1 lysophospholipase [Candidatus Omnitrophota bacterium]
MRHEEFSLETFDKLTLFGQSWKSEASARATLVFIHGSFEHSGRYRDTAAAFVQNGYNVYAFDLRGHGRSDGERASIHNFSDFVRDAHDVILYASRQEQAKPLFVIAHSVGGVIAIMYALTYAPSYVSGFVLCSPALKLYASVSPLAVAFAGIAAKLFPQLKVDPLNPRFLSRDPAVVSAFTSDPFCYRGGFPAAAAQKLLRSQQEITPLLSKLTYPLFIVHGTEDKLASIEGSRLLYQQAGSPDKSIRYYEGFYHELLNEPQKERVISDILDWLSTRAKTIA